MFARISVEDGKRLDLDEHVGLDQVLDKWSLQVLDALCERPLRFNELRRAIPVVTQKPLTATLRRLERNGMVERASSSWIACRRPGLRSPGGGSAESTGG